LGATVITSAIPNLEKNSKLEDAKSLKNEK